MQHQNIFAILVIKIERVKQGRSIVRGDEQ